MVRDIEKKTLKFEIKLKKVLDEQLYNFQKDNGIIIESFKIDLTKMEENHSSIKKVKQIIIIYQ